jgi:RNA polymerase sigma-70 factor (ECF subfamily)
VGGSLADELASQVFLVAFDSRAKYDPARPDAGPWLFGIATNLLRNHHRQEQRQLRAYARAGASEDSDPLHGVESRVDASRLRPQLTALLAALPREESEPLLLYAWAELSYEEISDALDLPVGTIKSRLSRVRGRIREQLRLQRSINSDEFTTTVERDHG